MNIPDDNPPQTPPSLRTLEAEELVLKDSAGKVGVRLSATPIGSKLALYGESGAERVLLSVLGEQPGVILYDAQGKARASLTVGDNGPCLALEGTAGSLGATLMVRDDQTFLGLHDTAGTPRAVLFVRDEEPLLYLYDANGKPRALLGVMFDDGLLHLTDASGKRSVRLGGEHRESFFGYAALVCWAALLLLVPTIVRAESGSPLEMLGGALVLGGAVSTAFWVRYRCLWWKTKGRKMASYLTDREGRGGSDASQK